MPARHGKTMEKKEARIKCNGCGTSYKLKIPVTDKPVSFKCKKCGKVLKIQIKSVHETKPQPEGPLVRPPEPPPYDTALPTEFETTQLPDAVDYHGSAGPPPIKQATFVESHEFGQADAAPAPEEDRSRRWLVLSADLIRGPFSDNEIVRMIRDKEIVAGTSLRLGDRPWIKASEIAQFRQFFEQHDRGSKVEGMSSISLDFGNDEDAADVPTVGPRFYQQLSAVLLYPMAGGKPIALGIFVGIAFVLSTVLAFEFLIGLPLNILGWFLLYGYLSMLMNYSMQFPLNPPPEWNFALIKEMYLRGASVFAVLAAYSLVPATICLLAMIAFFLRGSPELGYLFLGLTIIIFAVTMFVVPAALAILGASKKLGAALSPSKIISVVTKGGKSYLMLGAFSVAIGLCCMIATVMGVFLVDIPAAGFVLAGLVMALLISYAHFVWFHVLGRFSTENRPLMSKALAAA